MKRKDKQNQRKFKKNNPDKKHSMSDTENRSETENNGSPDRIPETAGFGEKDIAHILVILLALTVVVFVFYGNTLDAEFVYDDLGQIQENTRIRDLSNIPSMFTKSVWSFLELDDKGIGLNNYYRPVQFVVYALIFHFAQLDPGAYHKVSVVLHLLNTFLVFLVIYRLIKIKIWGFLGALIFAAHPAQTEVVAWVACQPEQLYTMCYIGAVLLYLRFHSGTLPWFKSPIFYAVVLLYYAGLFCKEAMVTLPVLLLAIDILKYRDQKWETLFLRTTFFAAAFILYLPWRYMALGGFAPFQRYEMLPWINVFMTIPDLLHQYIRKMLFPIPLNAYYKFMPVFSFQDMRLWTAIAVLILFMVAGYMFWRKKMTAPMIGMAWFVLGLGPMLYIRGIGENVFCERYLYFPSIGFIIMIVYCIHLFFTRFNTRLMRGTLAVFIGLLLIGMGTVVRTRNADWHDKGAFMNSLGRSRETTPGFLCHDKAVYLVEQAHRVPDPEERIAMYREALKQF